MRKTNEGAIGPISVSMSPQQHSNLAVASVNHTGTYSAEEILKGLGDPREHVRIKANYGLFQQEASEQP